MALHATTLARPVAFAASLGLLVALARAGDTAAASLHLPIPGMLVAAVALVIWLARRPADAERLPAADRLVSAMPLLFVPLVVEAVAPLRALGAALLPFAATVVAATLAALIATIAVARLTAWLFSRSR